MEDPTATREKAVVDFASSSLPDAVKSLERGSARLPTDQDFHFYSNFAEFKTPVGKLHSRAISLLSELGSLRDVCSRPSSFPAEPDEAYDWLVGVQDDLLERVDAALDKLQLERKDQLKQKPEINAFEEASKLKLSTKSPQPVATGDVKGRDVKVTRAKDKATARSPIPFHIASIPRPQDKFDQAVDNSSTPFRHPQSKGRNQLERHGICSQRSLAAPENPDNLAFGDSSALSLDNHVKKSEQNTHPMEEELKEMAYVDGLLDTSEIRKYKTLNDTPFTFVSTLHALKEMASKLRVAGEIAVDLENHHYRSYQGFVCLMQVSTRNEDFVVDTLDLRSQIGPCLGDIFADPDIRKVMHGADHDILWLQRDFGIYVCNLFDTGQAARVLQLSGFGLAFLLEQFCGVHADKRYQLADWRIRPLPSEMLKYAREDTHYLLYVHDMLKHQLLAARADGQPAEEDPLLQVYKRSRDICLQLYSKDVFTETSYQHLYGLQEKNFRHDQLAVLAALYAWRDQIARKEDESTGYVMPNHLLLQLASEMPDNVRQMLSFGKGAHSFVVRHAPTVVEVIRQSKEKAVRELEEQKQREESLKKMKTVGEESSTKVRDVDHSGRIQKTQDNVVCRSPQSGVKKSEIYVLSDISEADCLLNQSNASLTAVTLSKKGYISSSEATGLDEAIDVVGEATTGAVPEVRHTVEQLTSTSEVISGPVVVSRRMSSSLFNTRPRKVTTIPISSSNVSITRERVDMLGTEHSPPLSSTALPCALLASGGLPTPGTVATKGEGITSLDEGQRSQGRATLENILVTATEGLSMEIQTCSATCSLEENTVDSGDDMFMVPEILVPEESLGHAGQGSETHPATENFCIPAAPGEDQKDTKDVLVVQAKKKPSRFGALLGTRSRLQQTGASQIAKEFEQVRIKAKDIESTMVLPFNPLAQVPLGSSKRDATRGAKDCTSRIEENGELEEDTSRPNDGTEKAKISISSVVKNGELEEDIPDDETEEQGNCSKAPHLPDVLMLEGDGDGLSPEGERETGMADNAVEEPSNHRKWWPSTAKSLSLSRGEAGLSSRRHHRDAAPDHLLLQPQGNPDLPLSLSEMRHNSKSSKRSVQYLELSRASSDNPDRAARDLDSSGHGGNRKRGREKSLSTGDELEGKKVMITESRVGVRSFNYKQARNALGLDDLYGEQVEERQGTTNRGRGRGSKRGSSRPSTLLNKSAFDPLRRVREEPRPEGIEPGQRRQVFPQTGNCTAVFRQ